jgi:hypothetical protein
MFLLAIVLTLLWTLTPEQRSLRARIAANTRWSRENGRANAERAQRGLLTKFYDQTDPALPDAERWRRADSLRRVHMQRLAFKSSKARGSRKAEGGVADDAA